jgi:hypothetical protein
LCRCQNRLPTRRGYRPPDGIDHLSRIVEDLNAATGEVVLRVGKIEAGRGC